MLHYTRDVFEVDYAPLLFDALQGYEVPTGCIGRLVKVTDPNGLFERVAYAGELGREPLRPVGASAQNAPVREMINTYGAAGNLLFTVVKHYGEEGPAIELALARPDRPHEDIQVRIASSYFRPAVFIPYILAGVQAVYFNKSVHKATGVEQDRVRVYMAHCVTDELFKAVGGAKLRTLDGSSAAEDILSRCTPILWGGDMYYSRGRSRHYNPDGTAAYQIEEPEYLECAVISFTFVEEPGSKLHVLVDDPNALGLPGIMQTLSKVLEAK